MDIKTVKKLTRSDSKLTGSDSKLFGFKSISEIGKYEIRFLKTYNDKTKERFFSEIGMLLSAGVDLQTVLDLSTKANSKSSKLVNIYKQILDSIAKGMGLSDAMRNTGQFNNFDCYSVLIGENTGELSATFNKLHIYYNKKISQRRKITSALSYPAIVLLTTVGAVFFMLKFVVPMFADTLTRFGGELPVLTRIIIRLSNGIGTFSVWLVLASAVLIFIYSREKHKENVMKITSKFILSLPYIGKLVQKTYMAQFTQAMELLLSARVSIVESLTLTQKMVNFYPIECALEAVKKDILKGEFFYKGLEKQDIFDTSMVTLVKIGEEVNQLDQIFLQLSKKYEAELDYQSSLLISILEPLIILVLAIIIGTILIAMYLPMFKIGTIVH